MLGRHLRLPADRQTRARARRTAARRRQGRRADQHHPQAGPAGRLRDGRDPAAPGPRRGTDRQHPVPGRGEVRGASSPREVRRHRLPGRTQRDEHPVLRPDHRHRRRVRLPDLDPLVPAGPQRRGNAGDPGSRTGTPTSTPNWSTPSSRSSRREGWKAAAAASSRPRTAASKASIDHDDLSLGSGGGASGSAAGPHERTAEPRSDWTRKLGSGVVIAAGRCVHSASLRC